MNRIMTSDDSKLSSKDLDEMLDISNLSYVAEDDANLIVERTQKIQYADSPTYDPSSNNLVIINWQTGEDYISGRDSSLRFSLDTTSTDGNDFTNVAKFGNGSVLNIFKRIRVVSRSGVVINDIDEAHLLNALKTNYHHTYEWRTEQQGKTLVGCGDEVAGPTTGTVYFDIPLSMLAGIFDLDMLLPSMLCRGLRIEATLAPLAEVFQQTAGGQVEITGYSIKEVQCNLDSYRLSAGAVNKLNDLSKSSAGLVIQYHDYENSQFKKGAGATNFSGEVRKVASMANQVWAVLRKDTQNLATDFFETSPDIDTYQYRIGSLYLPVQDVQSKNLKQYYQQVNYVLGRLNSGKELGVRFSEFGKNLMAVASIDRYWLKNSGLAINNSTTLTWSMTRAGNNPDAYRVDIFLKHTRSLSVFLNNIVKSE